MGSVMTCKQQYCCGDRYNCTGPEERTYAKKVAKPDERAGRVARPSTVEEVPEMRRTSEMTYPLEAPNGWFLLKAEHQHTPIRYATDFHEPLPVADGPWYVQFQKYPKGGRATDGRGFSLEEAWKNASENVLKREMTSDD